MKAPVCRIISDDAAPAVTVVMVVVVTVVLVGLVLCVGGKGIWRELVYIKKNP